MAGSGPALKLAHQIIDSLSGPWEPERYHDTYTDEVRELIKAHEKGKDIVVEEAPAARAEMGDLMQALEASVEVDDDQAPGAGRQVPGAQSEAVERPRPVPAHDHVGRVDQVVQLPAGVRVGEVEEAAALAEEGVGGSPRRQVGVPGRIQAQHVGSQGSEEAGAHRAGDHPGEVQHPDARGRQVPAVPAADRLRRRRVVPDQGLAGHGPSLRVLGPLRARADGRRHPAGGEHPVLDLLGPEGPDGGGNRLRVLPGLQRPEQRRPVPGVVRMGAHPAVSRGPEPREGGETHAGGPTPEPEVPLAPHRGRHVVAIEADHRKGVTPRPA